jgi:hypothetical protein
MANIFIGIFIVLHGLVHLFYFAVSRRLFELDHPIVGWPEGSWVFSAFLGESTTRSLASLLYILATVILAMSGVSLLFHATWWKPFLVGAAVFSSAIVILFWDGKMQQLPEKGFVGLLINIVLIAGVFLLYRLAIVL